MHALQVLPQLMAAVLELKVRQTTTEHMATTDQIMLRETLELNVHHMIAATEEKTAYIWLT